MDNLKTSQPDSGLLESLSVLLLVASLLACGAFVYWVCILK